MAAYSRLNLFHRIYLFGQRRQAWAKRHKNPAPRTLRHLQALRQGLPVQQWPESILCVGPRNSSELDLVQAGLGATYVFGVDLINPQADIRIKVGDIHSLPYNDNKFPMLWCSHVLEHARNPELAIREVTRVLRPGGTLFFAYPTGFLPNWHDLHDYGDPAQFLDRYFPGQILLYSHFFRSGASAEWSGLIQVQK